MIKITNPEGIVTYLHPDAIASITEAGSSSQWHGIKCYIKCFDGKTLECCDLAQEIAAMLTKEPS